MDLRRKLVGRNGISSYWFNHVGRNGISSYVVGVVVVGLAVGLAWPISLGHTNPAGICPAVQSTQKYTFLYGDVAIDATPAPAGSVVEARNPRGDTVGCETVDDSGGYPLMYVYVDLSATSASCPYDFNDTPGVDIGDIILIAGAWRATDADSLATYDFNSNDVVDVGDIMTVVAHLGRPCS